MIGPAKWRLNLRTEIGFKVDTHLLYDNTFSLSPPRAIDGNTAGIILWRIVNHMAATCSQCKFLDRCGRLTAYNGNRFFLYGQQYHSDVGFKTKCHPPVVSFTDIFYCIFIWKIL